MSWKSQKQQFAELQEEAGKVKKLDKLIQRRREQNTYKSNGKEWTIPDQNIMVSISELTKVLR